MQGDKWCMNYSEVLEKSRPLMGAVCKSCPVCNGRACKNQIPGPGAKGNGDVAMRNYDMWQKIRVNMDTISENVPADTSATLFGKSFVIPVFAGPVGAVNSHYGDSYDDVTYNDALVTGCAKAGIAAFTGDGKDSNIIKAATQAIKKNAGIGVPTIKPWGKSVCEEKFALAKESGAFAVAMDIDAAGLPFLKGVIPAAGRKTVSELKEIIDESPVPFIVKGVMTVAGALKAKEAGASAIVVSNHGGRVLDGCLSTAEVLEDIVKAVDGSMTVLVDGGIRSGLDVFKALALGADGVMIARPFVNMVFGAGQEGIQVYVDRLKSELADVMEMCGAKTIDDISRDMITWTK